MTPEQIVLKAVAGVSSHAIFAFDSSGKVITWNEGVRQVLGFEEGEFLGSDADRIFTQPDRERGEPERERELAFEKGTVGDFRWHLRKDGVPFWANGVLHFVGTNESGERSFVKIMRDATEDRDLQEALQRAHDQLAQRVEERTRQLSSSDELLKRSEARFYEVFRMAPIAILLNDLNGQILDANSAFEQLTGYSRDEVVGHSESELGLWSSPEDQRKLNESKTPEGGTPQLELQFRTKQGQIREVIVSAAEVDVDHTRGLVKMLLDVTERKRTERQLMLALQDVMQDASWLANRVMEKLVQAHSGRESAPELSDLTERERDVLVCLAQGKSNEVIGRELHLAPSTVRNYIANIYSKIGVSSRAEAVVWARDRGVGGL